MPNHLSNQLQAQGHRITPQRAVILRVIEQSDSHLTAGEVYQRAHEVLPELTEPTVYRTLAFLADQGLLLVAHVGNGQLVYEAAGHAHHHLICRACNYSIEIAHTDLEPLFQQLQTDTGFVIDSMHSTFFGLCPHCKKMLKV
jgi:Fe2+ or Zn2+ uptake regulation protein